MILSVSCSMSRRFCGIVFDRCLRESGSASCLWVASLGSAVGLLIFSEADVVVTMSDWIGAR